MLYNWYYELWEFPRRPVDLHEKRLIEAATRRLGGCRASDCAHYTRTVSPRLRIC